MPLAAPVTITTLPATVLLSVVRRGTGAPSLPRGREVLVIAGFGPAAAPRPAGAGERADCERAGADDAGTAAARVRRVGLAAEDHRVLAGVDVDRAAVAVLGPGRGAGGTAAV